MKQKLLCQLLIISVILTDYIAATELVTGPAASPFTFDSTVSQKVYCRASGTIFLGLSTTDGTSSKSLWSATRSIGTSTPSFTSIAGSSAIQYLTLVSNIGNAMPFIGFNYSGDTETEAIVYATSYNGGKNGQSAQLNDANGSTATSIVGLSGMLLPNSSSKGFIFAAVSPNSTNTEGSFGSAGSGIAAVCLNGSSTAITLYQTAADSSLPSTAAAKRLDPTSSQVLINATPTIKPFATMHWDDELQRLYIGLELSSAAGTNNGIKAVVVGQIQDCGKLNLYNIAPNSAFTGAVGDAVVGAVNSTSESVLLWMHNVKTMHCSTGPSYLIINGGLATTDEAHNVVYALPIVDICQESPLQGTLAKYDSDLSYRHTFVVTASTPEDLAITDYDSVKVGTGPLPIQASTKISDIEVVGDTVYVSTATGQSNLNDNGIFYSQALFDKTGKIARWTPWTKRAFPVGAFLSTSCIDNGIAFFAVDAITGKIWAVDGQTNKVVHITMWDKGGTGTKQTAVCGETSQNCCNINTRCKCNCRQQCQEQIITTIPSCTLASRLCASLPCGCYSVLDLDQSTRGFTTTSEDEPVTLNRFALFGGCGKVIMARTSYASTSTLSSPQTVITDFCPSCTTLNYLETYLPYPDTTVCVNVLEYSRTNSTNQCYFFAGTDNGLYVYALTDANNERTNPRGFQLDGLNLETLSYGYWIKVATFSDPIIDIKTTGLSLYIVSRSTTQGTMTSKVSRVAFQNTVESMFDESNIFTLAQSGTTPFENIPAFTGIQPVAVAITNNSIEAEQLLLATNYGLFGSNAVVSVIPTGIAGATNQAQADWQRTPTKNQLWIEGIAGIDTPIPTTVWPISIQDLCGVNTYENSWIYQISNNVGTTTEPYWGKFAPLFFNAKTRTPAFENLSPITYFWSDGARRFFIINAPQDPESINRLMSFPYNTPEWRICAPGQCIILFSPYVSATKRFFWVKQIGITGILMAGTNNGIIALE